MKRKNNAKKIVNLTLTTLSILVIGLITVAKDNKIAIASQTEESFNFYRQTDLEIKDVGPEKTETEQDQVNNTTEKNQTPIINHTQTVTTGGETFVAAGIVFVAIIIAYLKTQTKKTLKYQGKKINSK